MQSHLAMSSEAAATTTTVDSITQAHVQGALNLLRAAVEKSLQPVTKDVLSSSSLPSDSADGLIRDVTTAIDATKNDLGRLDKIGLLTVYNASKDTSSAIASAFEDFRSKGQSSHWKKSAATLKIVGAASAFGVLGGPPGLIAAAVTSSLCALTAGILEQVERETNPEESTEAVLRRVIEEANRVQTFREEMARYRGKISGMSTRLNDLDHYCKNQDTLSDRHYNTLGQSEYLDDGEEFLDTLMAYIQRDVESRTDAVHAAALIYAYATTALVRLQQLNKLVILWKGIGDHLEMTRACERIRNRCNNDGKRFAWLRDELPKASNRLLHAGVRSLSPDKLAVVEAYVGRIPGDLCIMRFPMSDYFGMEKKRMYSWRSDEDEYVLYSHKHVYFPNKNDEYYSPESRFAVFSHYDENMKFTRTCSIFSVGRAGYLCPDQKMRYIVATSFNPRETRCCWKLSNYSDQYRTCELMPYSDTSLKLAWKGRDANGFNFPCHLVKRPIPPTTWKYYGKYSTLASHTIYLECARRKRPDYSTTF